MWTPCLQDLPDAPHGGRRCALRAAGSVPSSCVAAGRRCCLDGRPSYFSLWEVEPRALRRELPRLPRRQ